MSYNLSHLSTGIKSLDNIIKGLLPGDNIVWQVPDIEDYVHFCQAYAKFAELKDQKLVYFRYGKHKPIVTSEDFETVEIYNPNPAEGFEPFISNIHSIIKANGRGGYYIFDSLSELSNIWFSDRMLGNFFMLTCPYLLDMEALAYFPVIRGMHSSNALAPIHDTAQVILDVYNKNSKRYVHPLKSQQRYSPTMHMLHVEENETYSPVTNSALNSEILAFSQFKSSSYSIENEDIWNKIFFKASQAVMDNDKELINQYLETLLKMVVSREEKILNLAKKYFTVEDIIAIGNRIIGTGLIGGKSTGMLLARAMIEKSDDCDAKGVLEVHDSFFVGSDVFYTYMVINGCWWIRHQQKDIDVFLSVAEYARRVILTGKFPVDIVNKLSDMLDYFGQSPIIVRSSSLLEDNFGNAFSGKYESIFCPNQGSREKRLENLLTAIKTIYASTLSEKALQYRSQLGILDKDEQMPLLIQRVSGDLHGRFFFPTVGGVGYSYNPYVWDQAIDPSSGVIRIVYGMGTRAVDRSDDDYTRIAALNAFDKRPEAGIDEVRKFSQKKVDAIDLEANQLVAVDFYDISKYSSNSELNYICSTDRETNGKFITFDSLFQQTSFIKHIGKMLNILEKSYHYPVDIEFTMNFTSNDNYKINIVQCRPFEAQKSENKVLEITAENKKNAFIGSENGTVIGRSRDIGIDTIIYVESAEYNSLSVSQKHSTARIIGEIIKKIDNPKNIMLVGPGRWGTTTVSLGIPVTFSEINRASCVCEVVEMREDLIPDVSLGTHFFNDLVEFDILYLAFYPHKSTSFISKELFTKSKNLFSRYYSSSSDFENVIRVLEPENKKLVLKADIINQKYIML